ncbi:hypothetical protein FKM82_012677 [Ascaphus truei]
METDECSPTSLDSLCSVSDHTGFFGTIKNSPADFVVTEIDIFGNLVTTDYRQVTTELINDINCQESSKKQKMGSKDEFEKKPADGLVGIVNNSCARLDNISVDDIGDEAFTLQKENLETLEAISYLSSALGVLPSDFSYAGIKDKKAITHQAMVVKKVTPDRLEQIESSVERKGIKMYNMRCVNQHLWLGQLTGNHFNITVRDVKNHSKESSTNIQERISEAIHNVKTKGFINYYGPQRFGQGKNGQSHQIGLALLKEEMEQAVKLLFTPDALEDPVNNAKKYFLQTQDAKGALALLPEYKVRERMLLRALNRYGMNKEGCVRGWLSIPHSMRIFYVHAYCSKVWNGAASFRFMSYGSKVVEGDLVLCNENANEKVSLSNRVHIVSATEEESNIYSIQQVVLPMPGHSITYPTNKVGQWYNEALAKDELQACRFRIATLQLNIPGCYRHILKCPHNLSSELTLESDSQIEENTTENEVMKSSKQSLAVTFSLDSSCYATVCLREMMKCNF